MVSNVLVLVGLIAIVTGVGRLFGVDVALVVAGTLLVSAGYLVHRAAEPVPRKKRGS